MPSTDIVISYARHMPDCGSESPWVCPSDQFRAQNAPPLDEKNGLTLKALSVKEGDEK